MNDREVQQ